MNILASNITPNKHQEGTTAHSRQQEDTVNNVAKEQTDYLQFAATHTKLRHIFSCNETIMLNKRRKMFAVEATLLSSTVSEKK